MVRIISFDNAEEVFEHLQQGRKELDAQVEPWQAGLKPGDHFLRLVQDDSGVIAIYGEILAPEVESDEPDLYAQPHMKHFRFTRCYSVMCPGGELGDTHVAAIHKKLSPTQFNLARQSAWPSDARVRKIVEME